MSNRTLQDSKSLTLLKSPSDVLMHVFTFLTIIDYVCNVSLVCKEWNLIITKKDIRSMQTTAKFKLFKAILYHSFERKLQIKYLNGVEKDDLIYEMETSISFAKHGYVQVSEEDALHTYNFDSLLPQPLYFSADTVHRRNSYLYLLCYIHLYGVAPRNVVILRRMYVMLSRLVFAGATLCIEYILGIFYLKFGRNTSTAGREDEINKSFWNGFLWLFFNFYLDHDKHLQHKPFWVADRTIVSFVKIARAYASRWNRHGVWLDWVAKHPNNCLNLIIKNASKFTFVRR
eukprot:23861_1